MSGSTSYTQPPPVYEQARPHAAAKSNSVDEPLLSNSFADSPDEDIDDYKYGTTVSSSAIEIRNSFVRKVYTVLFLQLLGTTVVGATMKANDAQFWLMQNSWFTTLLLLGALGSMITLYFKRQSYPSNIALLGLFTIFESLSIGAVTCFYDTRIVLQALLITTFVFIGLTLFAMQTKYDLTSMGGVLYTVLLCFFFVGLLQIFFPFTGVAEMIYAGIGTLLFSGYILYDTQMIMNRLSPDEWVIGCLSLYLDTVNLFLMILRLLNSTQQD